MDVISNEAGFDPSVKYSELMLGCGHLRKKRIKLPEASDEFQNLVTLDINESVNPDIVHDLNVTPWPLQDEEFDEVHAYEVLEHLGAQGDYTTFFEHFNELHRIMKKGGVLHASVPAWDGMWAWGDPGHTRIITEGTLIFLDQDNYDDAGHTAMTDYRNIYKGDFKVEGVKETGEHLFFMLRKK